MLIHSYVTDDYYDFAVSLLESFKRIHGESIPFLMHTKDMSPKQIDNLTARYRNLTIKNSETDWKWLTKYSGLSKKEIMIGRKEAYQKGTIIRKEERVFEGWLRWKHYISIYSRYRNAIVDAFDFAGDGNCILHLDVDLFINRDITIIFNLIKFADVSLLLRPHLVVEWKKIYGCIMGFTVNEKSKSFMKRVRTHIDAVDFNKIPIGYGQTVFWRSFCDFKKGKEIKFAQIPETWVDMGFNKKALILSANNGLTKTVSAERYRLLEG